jgi:hypothetical protein
MLSAGPTLADSSDVLSDFSGQIVYVMRIPGIVLVYGAAFGNSRSSLQSRRQRANNEVRTVIRHSFCIRLLGADYRLLRV